jgi:hypothetical protein
MPTMTIMGMSMLPEEPVDWSNKAGFGANAFI